MLGSEKGKVVDGSNLRITGEVPFVPGVVNNAVSISDEGSIYYADKLDETCLKKPNQCEVGYTVSIWFRANSVGDGVSHSHILKSGTYTELSEFGRDAGTRRSSNDNLYVCKAGEGTRLECDEMLVWYWEFTTEQVQRLYESYGM